MGTGDGNIYDENRAFGRNDGMVHEAVFQREDSALSEL
jgi:hypothetical protein